jgi:hypothetical protein
MGGRSNRDGFGNRPGDRLFQNEDISKVVVWNADRSVLRVHTRGSLRSAIVGDVLFGGSIAAALGIGVAATLHGTRAIVAFWLTFAAVALLGLFVRRRAGYPYIDFYNGGVVVHQKYWTRRARWPQIRALSESVESTKATSWLWRLRVETTSGPAYKCDGTSTTSRSTRKAIVDAIDPLLAARGLPPLQ